MSWVAVGVVAVGAVSAGVSANSANKRAKNAISGYDDVVSYAQDNPGAFGEKLDWTGVDYKPLFQSDPGYGNTAGQVTAGNQRNLAANTKLAGDTNAWITQDALNRINTLDPTFAGSYARQAQNTQNLLRGDLPMEDLNGIISRRTEAQSLGGGGVNPQQVAADIGQTRLGLMQQGAANLTNNANLWQLLSPRNSYLLPQSQFVDVGNAIQSTIQENQFASQFAQSERNQELAYAMQGDPQQAGMLNLLAGRAGVQAANPTQNVGMAAFNGGLQAYGGYLASRPQQAPAQQQPQGYAPTYVPPPKYSANQSDFQNGIGSLSNTGPYVNPYAGTTLNPTTGTAFGEQGGLWSYYQNQNRGR